MSRVVFQTEPPPPAPDPNRADVACFVGFVARRPGPLPDAVLRWLDERGWTAGPYRRADPEALLDLPVPIGSWDAFDRLFAWNLRPLWTDAAGHTHGACATYLGAAVRSFFAQGGRTCYVVRLGDPAPALAPVRGADRLVPLGTAPEPGARDSWRGIGHLFGLPDVSMLCLPDLAELVGLPRTEPPKPEEPKPPLEQFVECATGEPVVPDRPVRRLPAPRCDRTGFAEWARAVRAVADLLARRQREVQFLVAVPIPSEDEPAPLLDLLLGDGAGVLPVRVVDDGPAAFVQLVYPWVRTPGSDDLPEGLESPDGPLAGVLARNARTRGAYRSAARLPVGDIYDVAPVLGRTDYERLPANAKAPARGLIDRVSLFGATPGGLMLLSDVTTSAADSNRPAAVRRLVAVLVRAARRAGEELGFEPSGERLWGRLRERMESLLAGLFRAGALGGATAEDAFEVRCDRSTMTQSDLDGGRAIVRVAFTPALPIERITVVLALSDGGVVSLVPSPDRGAAA